MHPPPPPESSGRLRRKLRKVPLAALSGIAGAVGIAVNLLLAPEQWTNSGILVLALAHVWCLVSATYRTRLTWSIYLVLYLVVAFVPDARLTAFVFLAPVMAGLVAFRGHIAAATWGGVLIAYAGSIDPLNGVYLPTELLAVLVWVLLLVAAVVVGRTLHQMSRQRRELIDRWHTDVQQRRENLARSLHDSVAASLTSIVMRAEVLNLRRDLEPDVDVELGRIADHARSSMSEVRGLLHVLSTDATERPAEPEPPLLQQLDGVAKLLRAHGFHVELRTDHPSQRWNADQLVALRQICTELATNVVKYAEPGSRGRIHLETVDGALTLGISNVIGAGQRASCLTSGLGLPGLVELAARLGGKLRTESDDRRWCTTLALRRS